MFDIEKEREVFEQIYAVINGLSGSLIKSAFERIGTDYVNLQTKKSFDLWLASTLRAEEKLEGCVVVPVNNTTIITIEKMVEQQVEASGITADIFRLDGEKILNAAVDAARGGK